MFTLGHTRCVPYVYMYPAFSSSPDFLAEGNGNSITGEEWGDTSYVGLQKATSDVSRYFGFLWVCAVVMETLLYIWLLLLLCLGCRNQNFGALLLWRPCCTDDYCCVGAAVAEILVMRIDNIESVSETIVKEFPGYSAWFMYPHCFSFIWIACFFFHKIDVP